MPWRLYDWQCTACGEVYEHVIYYPTEEPPPRMDLHTSKCCDAYKLHTRLLSTPAPYLGEKLREAHYMPRVAGGSFDTLGRRALPRLPSLPGEEAYDTKVNAALREGGKEAAFEAAKDGPTAADYRSLHNSPEWKHAKAERKRLMAENRLKQRRAAAGETPRSHPLPGDPKAAKAGAT